MDISVFFSRTGPSELLTGHKHGPKKAALLPEEGVRHPWPGDRDSGGWFRGCEGAERQG